MKGENITEKDVTFFFNKYKYNSDQIFHLERRLLSESYDFDKWEQMLDANSKLTRAHFAENEKLIEEYIRPVFNHPEQLSKEAVHAFILHVTFFLFENNLDSLLTDDLVSTLLEKYSELSDSDRFDASLCAGMSRILMGTGTFENAVAPLDEALKIYPDVNSVPEDLNIKLHVIFCKTYKLIAFNLFKNKDEEEFLKIFDSMEKDIRCGNQDLYKLMWNGSPDYDFHVELLIRLFRFYGIFLCTYAGFKNQRLTSWMEEEFAEEQNEGFINPMILTLHYKYLFEQKQISEKDYKKVLTDEMQKICKDRKFIYPESAFPDDDDPVPEQKALLQERTKLFNSSATCVNVLIPELFSLSSDDAELRELIAINLLFYYGNAKYAEKGFQTDRFVMENLVLIAKCFDSISEFTPFLQTIMVHREINSSIHFSMVSNLSGMCLSHFLNSNPELFVTKEYPDVEAVNAHRSELLQFMKDAGSLHDVGKIGRTHFVNLHFRRITDNEYEELKEHTSIGFEFVKQVSYLKKFSMLLLCHHKYYNGKGGYPENVDSKNLEYKAFLDIISICDTIDTATDFKGRNYAKMKTFDEVLQELEEMPDRYNPQLVKIIQSDDALKEEIRYMTTSGRNYISYEIFHKFVQPLALFDEKNEKAVSTFEPSFKNSLSEFLASEKKLSDVQISQLFEQIENNSKQIFVLTDKENKIYGYLNGNVNSENSDDFFLEDLFISSDARKHGWGTEMLLKIEEILKARNFKSISLKIPSKKVEGFFWIEGFSKKDGLMIKII